MKTGKPPVLSDEEIKRIGRTTCNGSMIGLTKAIAEAQRDADAAYYEPIIQQAKAEVAREIFEEIQAILKTLES